MSDHLGIDAVDICLCFAPGTLKKKSKILCPGPSLSVKDLPFNHPSPCPLPVYMGKCCVHSSGYHPGMLFKLEDCHVISLCSVRLFVLVSRYMNVAFVLGTFWHSLYATIWILCIYLHFIYKLLSLFRPTVVLWDSVLCLMYLHTSDAFKIQTN